jgi:hypothetical protein
VGRAKLLTSTAGWLEYRAGNQRIRITVVTSGGSQKGTHVGKRSAPMGLQPALCPAKADRDDSSVTSRRNWPQIKWGPVSEKSVWHLEELGVPWSRPRRWESVPEVRWFFRVDERVVQTANRTNQRELPSIKNPSCSSVSSVVKKVCFEFASIRVIRGEIRNSSCPGPYKRSTARRCCSWR